MGVVRRDQSRTSTGQKGVVDIIRQCKEQNTPGFFEQWIGPRPKLDDRLVDGKEHNEYTIVGDFANLL